MNKAIEFAAIAHDKQYRKSMNVPYISHPYTVGMMLLRAGCNEETVAAALLHDVVEDTSVTIEDVEKEFGSHVAKIVAGCTEPAKSHSWEERKNHTIERLKHASLEIKLVACADKIHNLTTIIEQEKKIGAKVWDHFKRGREKQEWYYRQILESILYGVTEKEKENSLFCTLKEKVEILFG